MVIRGFAAHVASLAVRPSISALLFSWYIPAWSSCTDASVSYFSLKKKERKMKKVLLTSLGQHMGFVWSKRLRCKTLSRPRWSVKHLHPFQRRTQNQLHPLDQLLSMCEIRKKPSPLCWFHCYGDMPAKHFFPTTDRRTALGPLYGPQAVLFLLLTLTSKGIRNIPAADVKKRFMRRLLLLADLKGRNCTSGVLGD